MLNSPIDEIQRRGQADKIAKNPEGLFTRSRILFLISVFIVFSLPMLYRYFSYLIK